MRIMRVVYIYCVLVYVCMHGNRQYEHEGVPMRGMLVNF
jgi:hypothetical protein